jgi:hypothetical protein
MAANRDYRWRRGRFAAAEVRVASQAHRDGDDAAGGQDQLRRLLTATRRKTGFRAREKAYTERVIDRG